MTLTKAQFAAIQKGDIVDVKLIGKDHPRSGEIEDDCVGRTFRLVIDVKTVRLVTTSDLPKRADGLMHSPIERVLIGRVIAGENLPMHITRPPEAEDGNAVSMPLLGWAVDHLELVARAR